MIEFAFTSRNYCIIVCTEPEMRRVVWLCWLSQEAGTQEERKMLCLHCFTILVSYYHMYRITELQSDDGMRSWYCTLLSTVKDVEAADRQHSFSIINPSSSTRGKKRTCNIFYIKPSLRRTAIRPITSQIIGRSWGTRTESTDDEFSGCHFQSTLPFTVGLQTWKRMTTRDSKI